MDKNKYINSTKEVINNVLELNKLLSDQNCKYGIEKLIEYADGLFSKAPFKEGDRVKLIKTPTITNDISWGWLGAKHFLIEGATARVINIDFNKGKFIAGLYFDNETWLSSVDKSEQKVDRSGLYYFSEDYLEKLPLQY